MVIRKCCFWQPYCSMSNPNVFLIIYSCDVTSREAIFALVEKVQKEHGFVDIIVNNAGIMPCRPLLELTEQEIRLMYEINVLAHFWVSSKVI